MELHRIMGVAAAVVCMVLGIKQVGSIGLFFNIHSVILVCVGSWAMVMVTHGRDAGRLFSTVVAWFFRADSTSFSPGEHRRLAALASDYGQFALLAGAVGTVIGHVKMLQNMSDPSAIGPALAVSFLTLFYGVVLHMIIAVPVSQHHLRMAGSDASEFNPIGPGLRLLGVLGIATGIAFFVMLLAMANF